MRNFHLCKQQVYLVCTNCQTAIRIVLMVCFLSMHGFDVILLSDVVIIIIIT